MADSLFLCLTQKAASHYNTYVKMSFYLCLAKNLNARDVY
jgi:hypothetical protein